MFSAIRNLATFVGRRSGKGNSRASRKPKPKFSKKKKLKTMPSNSHSVYNNITQINKLFLKQLSIVEKIHFKIDLFCF